MASNANQANNEGEAQKDEPKKEKKQKNETQVKVKKGSASNYDPNTTKGSS